ncbi:MAG: NAD-dependent epimerase/dehydratase family protein [Bacteroidetes bacterium]|nr:MAG: NAD-dependent epimerase/dehydratase family protein [Bacteroidota bacterium]
MKKIVVTGGAGFIGSHITDALISAGHSVHVVDDLSGGIRDNINSSATFHELDIRSEDVARLFQQEKFEVLVHHAAQMDVRRSVADPRYDSDVNIGGLLNLMEAGRMAGLQKVLFASTGGAIYGEPDYAPQDENHTLRPLSPYGIAKFCSEKYLEYYRHAYGIEYVALRYGNVYGPRQNPHGEAGVVAIFSERMLSNEPVYINGTGEQTRDYVYVEDVVQANLLAMDHSNSDIFNVGTSVETSVNELFSTIRDAIDPSIVENRREGQPGEQKRSVLSYSKASEILGWKPSIDIVTGLRRTVDWFRNRESE